MLSLLRRILKVRSTPDQISLDTEHFSVGQSVDTVPTFC